MADKFNYPTIPQPKGIKTTLFPHQLVSVYNMEKLEENQICYNTPEMSIKTSIGINADMVGYGKTLSMVALILRDRMEWGSLSSNGGSLSSHVSPSTFSREYITCEAGFITSTFREILPTIDTTLILAGTSIIPQWITELKKAPTLRVKTITKKNQLTEDVSDHGVADQDVIIISPTLFNAFIDRNKYAWKRFIYDEPTTAKIPMMRNVIAGFTWLVTASPYNISPVYARVRPSFMRNVISFLDRYMDYITVKNPDEFVLQSFSMPPTKHVYYKCFSGIYRHIDGIVNSRIKQMIETGNIKGAILSLGGKETDNIMELVKRNKLLEIEEIKGRLRIWKLRGEKKKEEKWESQLKVAETQLKEIENRFSSYMESNCSICTEIIYKPVMEPSCQNLFCGKCMLKWLEQKPTCPMCRVELKQSDLIYIKKEKQGKEDCNPEEDIKVEKTKEDTIVDIIKKSSGKLDKSKYIVFSDFSGSFDTIRTVLKGHNISFVELRGDTETRGKKLDQFRKGDVSVIFLNSKVDSTGLNIQEATDIIMYHSMGEETTKQIIGRANRVGRKGGLTVHYLTL